MQDMLQSLSEANRENCPYAYKYDKFDKKEFSFSEAVRKEKPHVLLPLKAIIAVLNLGARFCRTVAERAAVPSSGKFGTSPASHSLVQRYTRSSPE